VALIMRRRSGSRTVASLRRGNPAWRILFTQFHDTATFHPDGSVNVASGASELHWPCISRATIRAGFMALLGSHQRWQRVLQIEDGI